MDHYKSQSIYSSSKVEELVSIPDDKYTPPRYPLEVPTFTKKVPFGSEAKLAHFFIDPTWVFINHGAFGAVVREAMETSQRWQIYVETQPLRALDRDLLPLIGFVIRKLAKFVKADPKNIVLVPNATNASTAVLKSFPFQPGDGILYLNVVYSAVINQLIEVAKQKSLILYEREIKFPVTNNEEIIGIVETALKECPKIKLAVFDHIASSSAVLLPVKSLIDTCHKSGVKVLIDGAHALGNIDLDLTAMNPDFYTANGHKWLCCAKGSAFLYVNQEFHSVIRPLVISHGFTHGFQAEFSWIGVKDYSALMAISTAIDFWEFYGTECIREYIHGLNARAATMLTTAWKTERIASPIFFKSMTVIRLPIQSTDAEMVQDWLHFEKKIEVPIKEIGGSLYVRISTHVYNEMEDYEKLAEAIIEFNKVQTKV